MTWRLAHALETLRAQVNAKWPTRSKDSYSIATCRRSGTTKPSTKESITP